MSGSTSLGDALERTARATGRPAIRQGRIVGDPDTQGRVTVTVASLTGPTQTLGPCPGAHPFPLVVGEDITVVAPSDGDRCWIAEDNDGGVDVRTVGRAVVVAWEPA